MHTFEKRSTSAYKTHRACPTRRLTQPWPVTYVLCPHVQGDSALARNLRVVTAATYDSDAEIFNILISAGANMDNTQGPNHPLLSICQVTDEQAAVCHANQNQYRSSSSSNNNNDNIGLSTESCE